MVVVFLLMSVNPESLENVLRALQTVDGLEDCSLYGFFDIVAKVETMRWI